MASWRDFARKEDEHPAGRANSANSAISPALTAVEAPNGTNGTNGAGLTSVIAAGLKRLDTMGVPKGGDPRAWRLAVKDAAALVAEGFAVQALCLGWSPLDLFGGQLAKSGDPYADGLAVWLQGRRVVALTDAHAIATDANGGRHFFNRPRAPGSTLLWALGRGR